jgi:hypothetical protein
MAIVGLAMRDALVIEPQPCFARSQFYGDASGGPRQLQCDQLLLSPTAQGE